MIKLKNLKVNNEYYIIDENGCYDDAIIKFKVIKKLEGGNKKGHVDVKFLKFIENNNERDVQYYNDEDVIEQLYLEDEGRIFNIEDIDIVLICLREAEKKTEIRRREFECENHTSPNEYPDWDGDESIMYYIENYREEQDEDYVDIEDELDSMDIEDLLKLLEYFNVNEKDIESKLIEFLVYQGLNKEEIRNKIIGNYIYNNFIEQEIIKAMNKLNIIFLKDKDWDLDWNLDD